MRPRRRTAIPIAAVRSLDRLLTGDRLRRIAFAWAAAAVLALAIHLLGELRSGWTDGDGHPFGEDFLNFWSGGALTVAGRSREIYDLAAFHRFEVGEIGHAIDPYHFSYPPLALPLLEPLGLLPYGAAWAVWTIGGPLAFGAALRRIGVEAWALAAIATPAVFVSSFGGQNGCWTAAILGFGLALRRERPLLAGLILSLLVYKPQLAWLVPVALLAGGNRRAVGGFVAGAAALLAITAALLPLALFPAYLAQGAILKQAILEGGVGVAHRMLSVFVLVRHAGGSLTFCYAAQAAASAAVLTLLVRLWRSDAAAERKEAALVLGLFAGSLYVSDYDLVAVTWAAFRMWRLTSAGERVAYAILVVAPLLAAPLAQATEMEWGALALWPALLLVARPEPATASPMLAVAT